MSPKLICIFLLIIPFTNSSYINNAIITCDGDDPKTSVCALETIENEEKQLTTLHIKKKCGKKSLCTDEGSTEIRGMYQCIEKIEAKKLGESCKYNGDCITNICTNEKCQALIEGQQCNSDYVQCGPGLSCSSILGKCTKLASEGQKCIMGQIYCDFGLECNYNTGICLKIGSIEIGQSSGGNNLACKSGISYKGNCVGVKTDGVCKKSGSLFKCESLVLEGEQYQEDFYCNTYAGDKENEGSYACPISSIQQRAFEEYIRELEDDIDFEDYRNQDKYLYDEGRLKYTYGKKDLMELITVYNYHSEFECRKLVKLDDDNEIEHAEDKKCEYNWLIKYLGINSSSKIKVKIILSLILGAFLIWLNNND